MGHRMFNKYGAMDSLAGVVSDDFRRIVEDFVRREIKTHAVDIHDLSYIMHETLSGVISEHILINAVRMQKEEKANAKLAEIIGIQPTE